VFESTSVTWFASFSRSSIVLQRYKPFLGLLLERGYLNSLINTISSRPLWKFFLSKMQPFENEAARLK
jgi:hypothetical protein